MRLHRAALSCLETLCLLALLGAAQASATPRAVAGEVLVGVRSNQDTPQTSAMLAAAAGQTLGHNARLHVYRLRLRSGLSAAQAAAQLAQRDGVLYVEPNGLYSIDVAPNDPSYASQWGPARMQADLAWSVWQPRAQVVVAVVDTGIDYTHPELVNKILRDATGSVVGSNVVGTNARSGVASDPLDDQGHGTHVAGIIGAQIDNGTGIAGIAGWNGQLGATDVSTKLMPVKVLDSTGSGTDLTVANGITWATDHGAQVINMSLGGGGSTTLQNAVTYALNKGVVVVAAAGNSGSSLLSYPAGYSGVISVAATDSTDTLTYFSNWGAWVSTAAPGLNIYSTLPTYPAGGGYGTNYGYLSGTSMATPHVAGEVALLLGQYSTLTESQVVCLVTTNADVYTAYGSHTIAAGGGRVNAYRALIAAATPDTGGTAVPRAPAGLAASPGDGLACLSWGYCPGATSYSLYRGTASGAESLVAQGIGSLGYTDTGLTNGVTYYYKVTALNSLGESPASNEACATPQMGPPAAPTGLAAAAGNAQVSLAWNAASTATSYSVYRGAASGTETLIAQGITATSFIDTGLANGTTYYYVVTATNAIGRGPASNEASATPQSTASALQPPTGLKANAGKRAISLSWTQSSSTGVVSNRMYRAASVSGPYTALVTLAAGTSYSDAACTRGQTYYYAVTAIDSQGRESGRSNVASATSR